MRIYRNPSASKGRATQLAGTSCVNYAGVMRDWLAESSTRIQTHFHECIGTHGNSLGVHTNDSIGFHRIPYHSIGLQRFPSDSTGWHGMPWDSIGFMGLHRVPWGSIGIHRHPKGGPRSWLEHHVLIMRELCGNYAGLQSYIFYRNLCHVHGNPIWIQTDPQEVYKSLQ